MEVYYVIGLDDYLKPQHTMRIASREPVTQDNISAAFKNSYAKVVIAQEVSGMGVAVESAKSDRKAALDALETILQVFGKRLIEADQIDAADALCELVGTIRAALTAQDVNAIDNKIGNE